MDQAINNLWEALECNRDNETVHARKMTIMESK